MAKDSDLLLAKLKKMKKFFKTNVTREVTLEGEMTFGQLENGLRWADFECLECVEMEPMIGKCRVQIMRDGNVYVTQLPKHIRTKAIFRDDNCTLTLGRNGRYYFVFTMPAERVKEIPQKLVHQAGVIAQKLMKKLYSL